MLASASPTTSRHIQPTSTCSVSLTSSSARGLKRSRSRAKTSMSAYASSVMAAAFTARKPGEWALLAS